MICFVALYGIDTNRIKRNKTKQRTGAEGIEFIVCTETGHPAIRKFIGKCQNIDGVLFLFLIIHTRTCMQMSM